MFRKYVVWMVAMLVLMFGVSISASAQVPPLNYGSGVLGKIDQQTPFALYTFSGSSGDVVTLRVISLNPGFIPTLSLTSPTGQQLAFSASDQTAPGPGNARIDVRLDAGGNYNVQVGSINGADGQFLIRLDGFRSGDAVTLSVPGDDYTALSFSPGNFTQTVTFSALPDERVELRIASSNQLYYVTIHGDDGTMIGLFGVADGEADYILPAGDNVYSAVIVNALQVEGALQVGAFIQGNAPAVQPLEPAAPASTEEAGA